MKRIFKRILGPTLALPLLGFAITAHADSTISNSLDESSCADDGQCVIFEVAIKMSSTVSTPQQVNSTGVINLPGNFSGGYASTVTRSGDNCVKQVRVPHDVFVAIIGVMRTLSGSGTQPPAFTPAQQTILLFYTTLMQQTLQFQCTTRDLSGGGGH